MPPRASLPHDGGRSRHLPVTKPAIGGFYLAESYHKFSRTIYNNKAPLAKTRGALI